jgi:hypothetical protein
MIQHDALFQDYNVEVPLKNLSQEILRRSAVLSPKPIYVSLSAPNALNITFIDTPGLPPPPSAGDVPQDIRVLPHFNGRETVSYPVSYLVADAALLALTEQARVYRRLGLLRRHQPVPVVR